MNNLWRSHMIVLFEVITHYSQFDQLSSSDAPTLPTAFMLSNFDLKISEVSWTFLPLTGVSQKSLFQLQQERDREIFLEDIVSVIRIDGEANYSLKSVEQLKSPEYSGSEVEVEFVNLIANNELVKED